MLKLYGSTTSPFVRHCRIALAQEEMPHEFIIATYDDSFRDSPTKKVPYLSDGALNLSDSSAIIWHIRQKAGKNLLSSAQDAEMFFLADTALDTGINLFLLEKDQIVESHYLDRQRARMDTSFAALNKMAEGWDGSLSEGVLRLGCLLTWVTYRKRYDFSAFSALVAMDEKLAADPFFAATAPPPQ